MDWKMNMNGTLAVLILCSSFVILVHCEEDLYKILGVRKSASNRDIKQAYKKLAREWHPDKNPDPSANDRFMKINEAYETLGDEEARRKYDQFGTSSADMGQNQRRHHSFDNQFRSFGSFFSGGGGGFRFHFEDGGGNDELIEKYNIKIRTYNDKILPESHEQPYFLYAYAEFCFNCMHVEMIWEKIVSDLENIGMSIGTVHVQLQRSLMYKLRVTSVPAIMVVIDGKVKHYTGKIAIPELRQFFRTLVPSSLITEITDGNFQQFVDGWDDNRVRMIFCDTKEEPSLRYMMPAFTYRRYVAAGFINTLSGQTSEIRKKYGIQSNGETLLMFNENSHPSAQVSMQLLPRNTMDDVIETNKYLLLPRLSSQEIFNHLCPAYSNIRKKSLCVVLITKAIPEHNAYRDTFRDYAQRQQQLSDQRVQYTYVYADAQKHFTTKLAQGQQLINTTSASLKVALLWRKEPNHIQFDWLEDGWYVTRPEISISQGRLRDHVTELLSSKSVLPYSLNMFEELVDEHRGSLFYRILQRLAVWFDQAYETFSSMDEITLVTVVTTSVCLLLVLCLFKTVLDEPRSQSSRRGQANGNWASDKMPHQPARTQADVFQMSAVTFDKFVVKNEPGIRTVVILVTQDTKTKLVNQFAQIMNVHSRSKAFQFAFLQLEDDIQWFTTLLQEATGRDLSHINPQNCLGTVLAINGPRKYFSMYHAHEERSRAQRQAKSIATEEARRRKGRGRDTTTGDFVGLNESSSDSEGGENDGTSGRQVLFEADLLVGLTMWMEKLCEGTTLRLRVKEWPPM